MSMHLWQEEAHHTDFLWHQRVTWSLISVQFHPIHKPLPLCECKDLQPHLTVAPPAVNTWLCKRMSCFSFVIYHFGFSSLGWHFVLMIKYSVWKHVCVSVNVLSDEHVILWSLTDCGTDGFDSPSLSQNYFAKKNISFLQHVTIPDFYVFTHLFYHLNRFKLYYLLRWNNLACKDVKILRDNTHKKLDLLAKWLVITSEHPRSSTQHLFISYVV